MLANGWSSDSLPIENVREANTLAMIYHSIYLRVILIFFSSTIYQFFKILF